MSFAFISTGILGIVSSISCFAFIVFRLQINHVIRRLLLFATVQQAIGYGMALCSLILGISGLTNIVTCFLGFTSLSWLAFGTQTCISAISIIRYCTKDWRDWTHRVSVASFVAEMRFCCLASPTIFIVGNVRKMPNRMS